MGILKPNTLFNTSASKRIKFYDEALIVTEGAAMLTKLPLCDIIIPYDQWSRKRIIIPASATNFELKLCDMGEVATFLMVKPIYDNNSLLDNNYLSYTIKNDIGSTKYMKELFVLSGNSIHPIQTILINNPDDTYNVTLDVLVCTSDYTATNNIAEYNIYINDIIFSDIRTLDFGTSIGIYNSDNSLCVTLELSTIQNLSIENTLIIIDSTSSGTIGLNFTDTNNALQAFSALNWLLSDPASRELPQSQDTTSPEIYVTDNVTSSEAEMALEDYSNQITITNIINYCISSIVDNRDDNINIHALTTTITKDNINYTNITTTGEYNILFTIKDLAGNEQTLTITLTIIS